MSKDITSLEDARALKQMGMPLNTPVIEGGKLPKHCDDLIVSILKAATTCRSAAVRYCTEQTVRNFNALKRAHKKLGREIDKLPPEKWLEEAGGRRLANPEEAVVTGIVGPRCFVAYEQWAAIITDLENGHAVHLHGKDVWPTET